MIRKSGRYEHFPDPFLTPLLIGGAIVGGMAAGGAFSKGISMPSTKAGLPVKTAEKAPGAELSEQEKRNRMLAASFLSQDLSKPKLSKTGLLGL